MRFLVADNKPLILKELVSALQSIRPEAEILFFTWPDDALEAVKEQPVDVAFLDIEMGGMTGLQLAERLKKIRPDMHIVFVTGYQEYAMDDFTVHATGYLLKPIDKEALERELTSIYRKTEKQKHIRVQTFGGFEVFVDGEPVKFARTKSKELLAYLIDCRGASVTTREAYVALFEEGTDTGMGYFRNIVHGLKSALQNAGVEEILKRSFNSLAIATEEIDCDYYRFLEGDPVAINQYSNDYMPPYSWAEPRNATFGFECGKTNT